jgi:hypothetical protein
MMEPWSWPGLFSFPGVPIMKAWLRRHRRLIIIVAGALAMYVGSYLVLSRRGMAEMPKYGLIAFFYVPADKAIASPEWEDIHIFLLRVYEPLNELDRALGTGKSPSRCILRGLSR